MPLISSPAGSPALSKLLSSSNLGVTASLVALIYLGYRRWVALKLAKFAAARKIHIKRDIMIPVLDTKRKAAIARGQAIDHTGCVIEEEDPTFTLDGTIFFSVEGTLPRAMLRKQLSRVAHWSDAALQLVQECYGAIPAAPPVDLALTDFMLNECNFKMEHADGSFMDHVSFCHDYCAAHYKGPSPRVLLLHSILGVGTNLFPMDISKLPQLAKLVTKEELRHIETFPSMLRLLIDGELIKELRASRGQLERLDKITLRRVIDNKEFEIDAETFWTHLNYHMVHFLDFLPVADWPSRTTDPFFQFFLDLRSFLMSAGQLRVTVELGSTCGDAPSQEALLGAACSPIGVIKKAMAKRMGRKYSAKIGHSLEYSLHWR
mmetsp:Transcript_1463/g.3698  ORF Transcript_1463/g.3698 Transcript_1463/m.3698 type:complete len:376 (-) Transcript_1463:213-1340(-)